MFDYIKAFISSIWSNPPVEAAVAQPIEEAFFNPPPVAAPPVVNKINILSENQREHHLPQWAFDASKESKEISEETLTQAIERFTDPVSFEMPKSPVVFIDHPEQAQRSIIHNRATIVTSLQQSQYRCPLSNVQLDPQQRTLLRVDQHVLKETTKIAEVLKDHPAADQFSDFQEDYAKFAQKNELLLNLQAQPQQRISVKPAKKSRGYCCWG